MAVLNEYELHLLAVMAGIDEHATIENKQSLLVALDVLQPQGNKTDQEYAAEISKTLNNALDEQYANPLPSVCVLRKDRERKVEFVVPVGHENESLDWNVNQEKGAKINGQVKIADTSICLGVDGQPMRREINGVTYERRSFDLNADMDIGYHQLEVEIPGQPKASTQLIHAPTKCYDPIDIKNGGKAWGVPVQLYEQRSDENQGIGDFSDLAEIADTVGKCGAGILGVNPLHAMFPNAAEEASPYAPASRTYFNHVYLDVTAVPEFEESKEATALYDSEEYTAKRRKAQDTSDVDYTAAFELKTPILEKCYDQFVKNGSADRKARFEEFKANGGDRLKDFALFQTLCEHFANEEPKLTDWRDWPPEFQDSKTPAVKEFAEKNKDRIGFYTYLQFETLNQMENVQKVCKDSGMKVGLYTDIAVGSAPFGFEGWGCKDLYMKASAGAPADVLSPNGQNWDVMGFKPKALKETAYQPFIEMLRNNMKTAGCTRLDHVLQLARLYMIPQGKSAKEGAFVYYPVDDLMAVAALESHRNKCMLIGEDLGQLPPGFQDKLMDHGILSYRVLPFEREWGYQNGGNNNAFRHPEEYPLYSTAAPSTHDTPSLASQWTARDVHLKDYLGYYESSQQRDLEFRQYESQRCALNWALYEKGCWDRVGAQPVSDPAHDTRSCPEKYEQAVADYLGQSRSAMLLFPFSDMFRTNYMGNIPGTRQRSESQVGGKDTKIFEPGGASRIPWKNWRPKMHVKVNEIKEIPVFKDIANILNSYRTAGNENSKEKVSQVSDFKRPGRTEEKQRDPKRVVKLYESLAQSGFFKEHAYDIIAAKFSEKRKQRDIQKTEDFKKNYEERRKAIEAKKQQYNQGKPVNNVARARFNCQRKHCR
ncbi:MAG: 4-alpha-glucanotransferase [Alphaproteobacteria bacterium]|nr:4-alpha-glucanotransferase [Alphaproteobacteria bacterium]